MTKDLDQRLEKRNKEIRIVRLNELRHGEVVKYSTGVMGYDNYLVVEEVEDGKVRGQIASSIGVNAVSIEDLAKKKVYIAHWDEY